MKIDFSKMHGGGNDFILVDNRRYALNAAQKTEFTRNFCRRRLAVGADGAIFLETPPLRWDFYNADGSNAEMCGNGARCFALFAVEQAAAASPFDFQTRAGQIRAEISAPNRARVQLTPATASVKKNISALGSAFSGDFINTGVPHLVITVDSAAALENCEVAKIGAALRYHQEFAPAGTNVNFIAVVDREIFIRTYERGVESETLACGTGTVAAAIVAGENLAATGRVHTRGGDILNVEYQKSAAGFDRIFLEGPAVKVFRGAVEFNP